MLRASVSEKVVVVFVVVSMRNLKVLLVDKYTGVGSPERRNNRVFCQDARLYL